MIVSSIVRFYRGYRIRWSSLDGWSVNRVGSEASTSVKSLENGKAAVDCILSYNKKYGL